MQHAKAQTQTTTFALGGAAGAVSAAASPAPVSRLFVQLFASGCDPEAPKKGAAGAAEVGRGAKQKKRRAPAKRKQQPKVVYVSSSSEEEEPVPQETVYSQQDTAPQLSSLYAFV